MQSPQEFSVNGGSIENARRNLIFEKKESRFMIMKDNSCQKKEDKRRVRNP